MTADPGRRRGLVLLALVAVLWGTTFVVVKSTVRSVDPMVLVLARFSLAALVFAPLARRDRRLGLAGLELGFWLWSGYAAQAAGLVYTTAGRSAFVTSINVILVPLFAGLAGRRVRLFAWAAAGLALLGVGLLANDGAPPNRGDLYTVVTAVTYAVYVLRLETHARRFAAGPLSAAQVTGVVPFAAAAVVVAAISGSLRLGAQPVAAEAGPAALAASPPNAPWLALLYLGLVATALTTWLQTIGQTRVSAPEAAVIYASEPVWAAVFAWLLLGERIGPAGMVGGLLILVAILVAILAQSWRLPSRG